MKRSSSVGLIALCVLLFGFAAPVTGACAQTSDQAWSQCNNAKRTSQVEGCSAVIQNGWADVPRMAIAFYNRGNAHLEMSEYAEAIADYSQAIARNPQYASAYRNRGVALSAGPRHDHVRAIADFDAAIELQPDSALAFVNRGNAHMGLHDFARAIDDFDEAVRLRPSHPVFLTSRCWARAVSGQRLDLALADCDTALRIEANDPLTYSSRGLVHLRQGRWEAALADYNVAIRTNSTDASSLYARGIAYLRLGQIVEGTADIEAATALNASVRSEFLAYGVAP